MYLKKIENNANKILPQIFLAQAAATLPTLQACHAQVAERIGF
jgi:hypothetical protein